MLSRVFGSTFSRFRSVYIEIGLWLGLWCFTPPSPIFHVYRGGQISWWRNPEYPEKITDLTNFITECCTYRVHLN